MKPMGMFVLLLIAVLVVITAAEFWKIMKKLGHPGWTALIPYLNLYCVIATPGKKCRFFPAVVAAGGALGTVVSVIVCYFYIQMPNRYPVSISVASLIITQFIMMWFWVSLFLSVKFTEGALAALFFYFGLFFLPEIFLLVLLRDECQPHEFGGIFDVEFPILVSRQQ